MSEETAEPFDVKELTYQEYRRKNTSQVSGLLEPPVEVTTTIGPLYSDVECRIILNDDETASIISEEQFHTMYESEPLRSSEATPTE